MKSGYEQQRFPAGRFNSLCTRLKESCKDRLRPMEPEDCHAQARRFSIFGGIGRESVELKSRLFRRLKTWSHRQDLRGRKLPPTNRIL